MKPLLLTLLATAMCVSAYAEEFNVVRANKMLVAEYGGKYYAMSSTSDKENTLNAVEVEVENDVVYLSASQAEIAKLLWTLNVSSDGATTTAEITSHDGKYLMGDGQQLLVSDTSCEWTWSSEGEYEFWATGIRTPLYNNDKGYFKNYDKANINKNAYSKVLVEMDYAVNNTGETSVVENLAVGDAQARYYNLQGVRVYAPTNGIFIRVQGAKAVKVVL